MAAYREYPNTAPQKYNILIYADRVWTHNIRGIEFQEDFKPESCALDSGNEPQMAAIIAAGEIDVDVYEALGEHGAIAVAGSEHVRTSTQTYSPF